MKYLALWFLLGLSVVSQAGANSLENNPSPYIRMHAHDKVHWQLWSEDVMSQARKQGKLVFISIGYYACHWCHVMRRESFNDAAIARTLNADFISVTVDRELNPSLDDYLLNFVQQTRGHAGWPLNVFVTPEGYPLVGMVYLPKQQFGSVIRKLAKQWKADGDSMGQLAQLAFYQNNTQADGPAVTPSVQALQQQLIKQTQGFADDLLGGFGVQSKFPSPEYLRLLLQVSDKKQAWLNDFLHLTLAQMRDLGLHDVVGGGFFRYTADPDWHTPHFEKMLYTNAGMIRLYTRAAATLEHPPYLQVARETVAFIQREMGAPGGGYISALSAQDDTGREGGSYLWPTDELRSRLSKKEWQMIQQSWQLLPQASGDYLPVGFALSPEWQPVRDKLMQKRVRHPAARDDKVLPAWNGYLLLALSELYRQQASEPLKAMGDDLADYLQKLALAGLGRDMGQDAHHYLEDFAMVAAGLDAWSRAAAWKVRPGLVAELVKQGFHRFYAHGGWQLSDQVILPRPAQPARLGVSNLPAPDVVLWRLRHQLGLEKQIKVPASQPGLTQAMLDNPFPWPGQISLYLSQHVGKMETDPQSGGEIR